MKLEKFIRGEMEILPSLGSEDDGGINGLNANPLGVVLRIDASRNRKESGTVI